MAILDLAYLYESEGNSPIGFRFSDVYLSIRLTFLIVMATKSTEGAWLVVIEFSLPWRSVITSRKA
jgi:hypothetical protein